MGHALAHFFGLDSASATPYLAWSGVGSDVTEIAVVGALFGLLRKHNCSVHGCWRIGRHKVPGTDHVCCRRHTPGGAPSLQDVISDYRSAREAS